MTLKIPFVGGEIHVSPSHIWRWLWSTRQFFGVFRNRDRNPALPRRWGFHILGFEIGNRG